MTKTSLKQYFPTFQSREKVISKIHSNWLLNDTFLKWTKEQQETFLDICTGQRGVKILYDCFFKEIFNPEYNPQRLSRLLTILLNKEIRVLKVLPNEATRITAEETLLVTDIVVEFEDGSIANIEVQKIGYLFPGERASCYSADLLLRQYKRLKDRSKQNSKKFNYQTIKPVHVIVFFERSPEIFHKFPQNYIHTIKPTSDTGIEINLLQNFLFIPLDIFKKNMHNKDIKTEQEAWLAFLCCDDPSDIFNIIDKFPQFREMYEDIFALCQNTERMMEMYSKELYELDHNTAEYMVDVMQHQIDEKQKKLDAANNTLEQQQIKLDAANSTLEQQQIKLDAATEQLQEKNEEILKLKEQIEYLKQKEGYDS
ncbi:MAG: PD-(D/E)XK nuclease family transposase [Clostridiales bacterium]|nr:PD-(D/E)XK nuclease family transposase [Clostridiales bacterium]